MHERQSFVWQDLNRNPRTKMRAGHAYEAQRPTRHAGWGLPALPNRRLLAAAVVGAPVALGILVLMAALVGH